MSDFDNLEVSPVSYFLGTLTLKRKYGIKHTRHFIQTPFYILCFTLIFLTKDFALWLYLLSLPFILKDRFACYAVS